MKRTLNEKVRKLIKSAAPCPGCGSSHLWANRNSLHKHHWFIECADCHWAEKEVLGLRRAIRYWNKKARQETAKTDSLRCVKGELVAEWLTKCLNGYRRSNNGTAKDN